MSCAIIFCGDRMGSGTIDQLAALFNRWIDRKVSLDAMAVSCTPYDSDCHVSFLSALGSIVKRSGKRSHPH
jgi:hypothetical protein